MSETTELEQKMESLQFLENIKYEITRGEGGWDWSQTVYQVRGPNYLKDKKKIPSPSALFDFVGMQMIQMMPPSSEKDGGEDTCPDEIHVARHEWSCLPREDAENEYLIVNYIVPGSPGVQVVMYFRASEEARDAIRSGGWASKSTAKKNDQPEQGWQKVLREFWEADKEYCDARFKIIPAMDKSAPWAVKMAVGEKPALVGKKITQSYFRGPNYFEIDMDMSSSTAASRILSLVRGLSTSLIVDVGITIEAIAADELPERTLCQSRLWYLDFERAAPLTTPLMRSQSDPTH